MIFVDEKDKVAVEIYRFCAKEKKLLEYRVKIIRVALGYSVNHNNVNDNRKNFVINCVDLEDYLRRIKFYLGENN